MCNDDGEICGKEKKWALRHAEKCYSRWDGYKYAYQGCRLFSWLTCAVGAFKDGWVKYKSDLICFIACN